MSAPVAIPDLAPAGAFHGGDVAGPAPRGSRLALVTGPLLTLAFAGALIAVALSAGGGLQLQPLTRTMIAIDLAAGALCVAAILVGRPVRKAWGSGTLTLFAAFAVLTGLSITWAIQPSGAWVEANRTLSAFAAMAGGVALVRLAPGRWRSLIGGVLIATVVISAYALLTKVFPKELAPDETYARLREPFGYWNTVGLIAALGVPPAIWLGARRDGHAGLAALAYPALGVLITAILLAYSRGSLLAAGLGMAVWFAVVPLRLRGATVLIPSLLLSLIGGYWAFHQDGLSKDQAAIALRVNAGQELGVLLVVLIVVLAIVGLLASFLRDRRVWPERTRRAWGIALIVALALCPVILAGALATTDRGLSGSVSHAWTSLTDPNANTPANDPSRLTAIGSVRSRYWRDAIAVFKARPVVGVGAGGYATARLRFRKDDLDVLHAHGYLVQTAADLGIAGLALTLALLAAFLAAAIRTTGPWRGPQARPPTAERAGLLTLLCVVVVFGIHSLVDWTWFVPGPLTLALLCAGWLAGRGPSLEVPSPDGGARARLHERVRSPARVITCVLVVAVAITAAYSAMGPQRAVDQIDEALVALADGNTAKARTLAQEARDTNPLSIDPLFTLATIENAAGRNPAALTAIQSAVKLQPANADTWVRLAQLELGPENDPQAALRDIGPALFLDPRSLTAQATFLAAYRQQAAVQAKRAKTKAKAKSSK